MNRFMLAMLVILGVPGATVAYVAAVEWLMKRIPYTIAGRVRPWLWLAPALSLVALYLIYPAFHTARLSLMNADSTGYAGLENYRFALTNPQMQSAFKNNVLWLIFFPLGTVSLGLLIAILADRVRYEPILKAVIFLPMAISYVAAGVIWKLMYEFQPPGEPQTGTVNAVLTGLVPGFAPQAWLFDRAFNNAALIVIGVWMWTGFCMVVLSAALKGIPEELLEAARVDGANEWQVFRGITLPLLKPTLAVVTTTMIINVLKIFDIVYLMTNGNLDTEVIANRMYKEMFNYHHFGRASAIAMLLFVVTLPVMAFNLRRFRQQEQMR